MYKHRGNYLLSPLNTGDLTLRSPFYVVYTFKGIMYMSDHHQLFPRMAVESTRR